MSIAVVGTGKWQRIVVTVVDVDSQAPIPDLLVSASAGHAGSAMQRPLPIVKLSQVRYVIRLRPLGRGKWRVSLTLSGVDVVTSQLAVDVARG